MELVSPSTNPSVQYQPFSAAELGRLPLSPTWIEWFKSACWPHGLHSWFGLWADCIQQQYRFHNWSVAQQCTRKSAQNGKSNLAVRQVWIAVRQSHWSSFGQDHSAGQLVLWHKAISGLRVGGRVSSVDCVSKLRLCFGVFVRTSGLSVRTSGLSVALALVHACFCTCDTWWHFTVRISDSKTISFRFELCIWTRCLWCWYANCTCSSLTLIVFTNEEHSDKACRMTGGMLVLSATCVIIAVFCCAQL